MAQAKVEIIDALRRTAKKLSSGNEYMWGHMGSCNCGNLVQEVTKRTKAEIHAYAMQGNGEACLMLRELFSKPSRLRPFQWC